MSSIKVFDKIKERYYFEKHFSKALRENALKIPWLSADEIKEIQNNKLKNILWKATSNVPFYKKFKDAIDWNSFTIEELNKLPIVSKKDIIENFSMFLSLSEKGVMSSTSGSTGEPFKYFLSQTNYAIERSMVLRAWDMGQFYRFKDGDPGVSIRGYSPKKNEKLYKYSRRYNHWSLSAFDINENNLPVYLDIIKKSKTQMLRGYPSSLYIFTLLLIKKKITLPQIKLLITSSETMLPHYRSVLDNYWNADILDWYGQNENTVTVQQCWAGSYHNNDDYGVVELGVNNEIIATSLNNSAMPFIRYSTGDMAIKRESSEKCVCGRNLSIPFKGIQGRSDDILYKEDGTPIPSTNFSTAFKDYTKLKQFQIIQHPNRAVLLKVVLDEMSSDYIDLIIKEVRQRLGNLSIEVKCVDNIERDLKTGKIKSSIQLK